MFDEQKYGPNYKRYVLCGTESTNIIRIQGPNMDILYEPTWCPGLHPCQLLWKMEPTTARIEELWIIPAPGPYFIFYETFKGFFLAQKGRRDNYFSVK